MSHVSHIQLKIFDLSAVKRACERLGFIFMENQKTYEWYGKLVQPELYPLPEGITEIQSSAFENCENLERVQLPETLEKIGSCAFAENARAAAARITKIFFIMTLVYVN